MGASQSPLGKVKAALRAFFVEDVKLRREGGGLRVVLERPGAAAGRPLTPEERRERLEQDRLARARAELAQLLDGDAALRSRTRHLAFVEYALEQRGWRGLEKVRLDVLERALGQFEDLVTNWEAEGLATLRSRMAVALAERRRRETPHTATEVPSVGEATELDNPPEIAAQLIGQAQAQARSAAAPGSAARPAAAPAASPEDEAERAALMATYAALGLTLPDAPPADGPRP